IADLHALAAVDHHVARLDVAVHDPMGVQELQRPQAVRQRGLERFQGHLLAPGDLRQIGLHQLQNQPAPLADDVVNRHDIGMLKAGQQLRLAPVPVELLRIGKELFVDLLDGDFAPQLEIAAAIDRGIAARGNLIEQLITGMVGHYSLSRIPISSSSRLSLFLLGLRSSYVRSPVSPAYRLRLSSDRSIASTWRYCWRSVS